MNILWVTWKDRKHPLAGGAERVNQEIARRCVADGHHVTFLTGGFPGASAEEIVDGCRIIRIGNMWSVHWRAYVYYKKHLRGWADVVIEEVNTLPFVTKLYLGHADRSVLSHFLFFHQLNREVWFHQMAFPLGFLGYLCEPLFLCCVRGSHVITISESTKEDLGRYCFDPNDVTVISQGNILAPVADPTQIKKYEHPTMLSVSMIHSMKRVDHIISAFEIAKESIPDLRLIVAGEVNNAYGRKVLDQMRFSLHGQDIIYLGKVSREKKVELMQRSHVIANASVKEGWGLTVTEANSQGTPAVVYDVDGLRDSVHHGKTGIVCKENTPAAMAKEIVDLMQEKLRYVQMQREAWEDSKSRTFDQSYCDFMRVIKKQGAR